MRRRAVLLVDVVKSPEIYDVIVIGAGGSGLACALAAVEGGAKVLLLEKRPQVGGTTGIAIGSFSANQTRLQQQAGITDDPEHHEEDAGKFGPTAYQEKNNHGLRRFFLGHTADTLHWLIDMGLTFHGPSPEPPNRVARMHNVVPNAKAYIALFLQRFNNAGGTLQCDSTVVELLADRQTGGQIQVRGVRVRQFNTEREVSARHAVVLAAGDYASSPEMIAQHRGSQFSNIEGINPYATGDGHQLAQEVGARLVNMEITYGPELRFIPRNNRAFEQLLPTRGWALKLLGRLMPLVPKWLLQSMIKRLLVTWQHPEDALFHDGAILLNSAGERFCNEVQSPEREIAVARQAGKMAYILLDQRLVDRYQAWPHFISTAPEIAYAYVADYLRLRPDIALRATTLDALCAARGLPSSPVRRTLDEFNRHANQASIDAFGRTGTRQALSGDRWVLLGPIKAFFTTTEGGAAINTQMQVLDQQGLPIAGLYAVGQNGLGGMVLWGHGLHIAWAITSGRLVGQLLARQARDAATLRTRDGVGEPTDSYRSS